MLTKGEGKSINFIVQNSFPLSLTLRLFSLFSPLCRLCLWSRMLSPRMCHYWNSYKFCVGCVGECCRMAGRSWADPPWRLSRRALEVKFVKHTHTEIPFRMFARISTLPPTNISTFSMTFSGGKGKILKHKRWWNKKAIEKFPLPCRNAKPYDKVLQT